MLAFLMWWQWITISYTKITRVGITKSYGLEIPNLTGWVFRFTRVESPKSHGLGVWESTDDRSSKRLINCSFRYSGNKES